MQGVIRGERAIRADGTAAPIRHDVDSGGARTCRNDLARRRTRLTDPYANANIESSEPGPASNLCCISSSCSVARRRKRAVKPPASASMCMFE
eukprot:scaffold8451_cov30-Tisochrysis_lutea.AAC.3